MNKIKIRFSQSHQTTSHGSGLFHWVQFVTDLKLSARGLVIVSLVILIQLAAAGCGQSPSLSLPIPSPDGRLLLKSGVNRDTQDPARYLRVIVEIKDLYGKTIFREITPASDTRRWSLQWIGNDRILLDSSDIGRYVIRRVDSTRWIGGFENTRLQS